MITFASPWILAGLAAVAAPLLIHLIRRERAMPLRFPSVRFILPSRLPREGRRKPSDWLLMFLRMLLVSLLVLAVAGMEWQPQSNDPSAAGTTRVALVVDTSASMQTGDRWAQAQRIAADFLRNLPADSRVSLIALENEPVVLAQDQRPGTLAPDSLQPGLAEGRPAAAIRAALLELGGDGPRTLAIISDFQAANWATADLPGVAADIVVELLPVETGPVRNSGILSARVFTAADDRLRVIARVRNFSDQRVEARLRLDNVESDTLGLDPGQSQNISLLVEAIPERPGRLELITDAADDYAPDDSYALWLGAPPPVNVLALLPLVEEPAKGIEVDFVRRALEVGQQSGRPTFRLRLGDISEPIPTRPDEVRILYLPGAGAYLDDSQWPRLAEFVEHGGLVFSTPGQAAPVQFRRMREHGLSAVEYTGRPGRHRDRFNPYRLDRPPQGSALAAVFDEASSRDLALTQLYQYVRLRPGDGVEVLLTSGDGDPLLLRERRGRGTVVSSAFGFDGNWTDLPLRNAFLPILREVLEQAAPADGGVLNLQVGDALPATISHTDGPVVTPTTSQPGAYRIKDTTLQINVARSESDPHISLLSDIRAALRSPAMATAAVDTATSEDNLPLWPWLALAALLLLGMESMLATGPGRIRTSSTASHA